MPHQSFLCHDIPFGLGTDNQSYNPFHTLWAAMARRERRSRAVFCGVEAQRGSLEAGKLADLTTLSDDPLQMPEASLPDLHAHLTFVGGRIVHASEVMS